MDPNALRSRMRALPRTECFFPWLRRVLVIILAALPAALLAQANAPALRDFAVLVDPDGHETVASVAAADARRFQAIRSNTLSRGYGNAAYWLRFTLDAPAGEWIVDVLPPYLNDVRLYEPDLTRPGSHREHSTGNLLPFSSREFDYRGFAFRVNKIDDLPQTFYLRIATTSSVNVVVRAWSPEHFIGMAAREAILLSASLALLLTLVFLNLIQWVWMREPLLLWFIAYAGSLALATAAAVTGFAHQYILPDQPRLADALVKVSVLLAVAFGTGFYRQLFAITRTQRWLHALYATGFWLPLAACVFSLLGMHTSVAPLTLAMASVITCVNLVLAARFWRRGEAGGLLAFVANVIACLGILAMLLTLLGVVQGGLTALYAMQISSLGTALALHLAIGAQLRAMREERRQALAEAARERDVRESQARFIDLLSHEYRTPVAVLQTGVDIIALSDHEAQREEVRSMRLALGRLRDLFASAQRNREWEGLRQVHFEALDPLPLLRRLVADMNTTDRRHGYRLDVETVGQLTIHSDTGVLQTVLANLLDNAAKYATRGSTVDVVLRDAGPDAVIIVANDSAAQHGLAEAHLLRGHTRGANTAGQPGLGMGLYLAERLVHEMHGALRIDVSQPERFVVTLSFPLVDPEHSP